MGRIYALLCWTAGLMALFKTDWVVKRALLIQKRFPNALRSRFAERSWYPKFLKVCGVLCLFSALICSIEIGLWIFAGRTINPSWR
jgi:hypothetical protein